MIKRAANLIILLFLCLPVYRASAEEMLNWQECVGEAAKNHPDLISAEEVVKQNQAGRWIAASTLFPQVSSSVEASRAQTTVTGSSGNSASKTQNAYSYGLSGSQLIFDGFKTVDSVKAAGQNMKAAQYNYRFTSTSVRLRLRSAFINLLKAQELLSITKEIYEIRRNNLELITLRYESGIEHRGALLTAQANLAQAEFDIERNNRALEVAQRQLIKEMGRKAFAPLRVSGGFKVSDDVPEKPDFELLARNNPSLLKRIAEKNAASFNIKAAQADFLPQLSVQAGASRTGTHWLPKDDQWNAGVVASLPIFEGGLRLAQVNQARALFNQAVADERSIRDGVVVSLEQTWAALKDALATAEVQKKFLVAAEERAKIAEAQYSLGLIQFDNWIIIEDDLVTAKRTFLDAQANALLAEANWIQAKGETLEYAKK